MAPKDPRTAGDRGGPVPRLPFLVRCARRLAVRSGLAQGTPSRERPGALPPAHGFAADALRPLLGLLSGIPGRRSDPARAGCSAVLPPPHPSRHGLSLRALRGLGAGPRAAPAARLPSQLEP